MSHGGGQGGWGALGRHYSVSQRLNLQVKRN